MAHDVHPLAAYRKAQKPQLSQRELAELLRVTRTTVARWETRVRNIDEDLLPKVSRITGISPRKLRPDLANLLRRLEPAA